MTRKIRSSEFKKRVAIEALKGHKTIREIASEFEVHPMQVSHWKNELLDGATTLFEKSSRRKRREDDPEIREAKLHEKIGQLTVELDWLKKKVGLVQ